MADETGRNITGSTSAIVTTDEASEEDTAPEDEPGEGDNPGTEESVRNLA